MTPEVPTTPMRIARTTFVVLLMLNIVMPTILQPAKMALMAVIVSSVLVARETWVTRSSAHQIALDVWAVLFAATGLAWSVAGLARGNPGAAAMLSVHTAYPLLAVILWRMARPGDLAKLSKYIAVAATLVLATQALFIASFFELDGGLFFQFFLNSLNEETAVVDSTDDYLLFSLPNISSLLFTAPWLAAHTLLAKKKWAWTAVLFLLSVGGLMLAGRRASLLALMAGLCASFIAVRVNGHRAEGDIVSGAFGKRLALLALTLTLVGSLAFALGALNADLLAERATSIFDFSTNESNIVRRLQFDALVDGVAERPLLGQGLGAAAYYTRSDDAPWSYELSYVALAFNFGIVGLLWFAAGVIYLLAELVQLVGRRGVPETERLHIACFLAGLVAFLIANATNPYLAKFDYMWTLFIPLAFVRLYSYDAIKNSRIHG